MGVGNSSCGSDHPNLTQPQSHPRDTRSESGRRSTYSAETVTNSLVIDVFRMANSTQNDLGS
ncbi:MAG: hypothetical protein ACI89X_000108, partial [Planctomycetota bacterium]